MSSRRHLPTDVAEHLQGPSRVGNGLYDVQASAEQAAQVALASTCPLKVQSERSPSRPFCRVVRNTSTDSNVAVPSSLERCQQSMQQLGPLPAPHAHTRPLALLPGPAALQVQLSSSIPAAATRNMTAAPGAAPATQAAQLQLAVATQPLLLAAATGVADEHMPADAAAGPALPAAIQSIVQQQTAHGLAHSMDDIQLARGHTLPQARNHMGALTQSHQLPQRLQPVPEELRRHARNRYASK